MAWTRSVWEDGLKVTSQFGRQEWFSREASGKMADLDGVERMSRCRGELGDS